MLKYLRLPLPLMLLVFIVSGITFAQGADTPTLIGEFGSLANFSSSHDGTLHLFYRDLIDSGAIGLMRSYGSAGWSEPVNLFEGDFDSVAGSLYPALAPDGSLCVFASARVSSSEPGSLFQRCANEPGRWGEVVEIAVFDPIISDAIIAADGTPYVLIQRLYDLLLVNGSAGTAVELSDDSAANIPAQHGRLARDSDGGLHVAFVESSSEGMVVRHRRSDDNGFTWSNPEIAAAAGSSHTSSLDLAADAIGGVHLVATPQIEQIWQLVYRKWSAGAWSEPVRIPMQDVSDGATQAALALTSGGAAHIAYSTNHSILYYTGQDADGAWNAPLELGSASFGYPLGIGIHADSAALIGYVGRSEVSFNSLLTIALPLGAN